MQRSAKQKGAVLALVLVAIMLLMISGAALIRLTNGRLLEAARTKSREKAFSAAEAAYEKALFWMTQQPDMLSALTSNQTQGLVRFLDSQGTYWVRFANFLGSRPVFHIQAIGECGIYEHRIDAYLVQAVSGWDLGTSRIPSSPTQLVQGYFVTGEVIAMPMHINDQKDSPDARDIGISGTPQFLASVSMGESRYTTGGSDKYADVINLFQAGIYFNQPASRIATPEFVQQKIERFKRFTNPTYQLKPTIRMTLPKHPQGRTGFYASTVSDLPAVHLKFYVKDGKGYMRIYNDCTVAGYTRDGSATNTWDYCLNTTSTPHIGNMLYTVVIIPQGLIPMFRLMIHLIRSMCVSRMAEWKADQAHNCLWTAMSLLAAAKKTLSRWEPKSIRSKAKFLSWRPAIFGLLMN